VTLINYSENVTLLRFRAGGLVIQLGIISLCEQNVYLEVCLCKRDSSKAGKLYSAYCLALKIG
jgi:hypothetical protein